MTRLEDMTKELTADQANELYKQSFADIDVSDVLLSVEQAATNKENDLLVPQNQLVRDQVKKLEMLGYAVRDPEMGFYHIYW